MELSARLAHKVRLTEELWLRLQHMAEDLCQQSAEAENPRLRRCRGVPANICPSVMWNRAR